MTSKEGRFLPLLNYLTREQDKTINEQGESFVLRQFLNGRTNEEMAQEFLETEKLRRSPLKSNSNRMIHEVLAFSDLDKEKITPEHLKVLSEAYLEKISPSGQAFVIAHFNEQHIHLHIVRQPLDIFGYSQRVDRKTFAEIKNEVQVLQQQLYPELSHSIVKHSRRAKERSQNKKQVSTKERDMSVRNPTKISDKARAREAIESCMIMAESKEHFYELLSQEGFKPYQRGNTYGITDNNRSYRFCTLINDYTERFNALDEKQERLEDLRDIRSNNQEREQYYQGSDNQNEDYDDTEESNDSDNIYTK